MIKSKNSSSVAGIGSKPTYFSDLDLDFNLNPATNDIVPLKNSFAIRRSVRNLILLNFGEKQFSPKVGSSVRKILFELTSPETAGRLQTYITQTLNAYEPRIQLDTVIVVPDYTNEGYNITIKFFLLNAVTELQSIDLFLERIR